MSDVQLPLGLRGEQTIVVGDGLTVPSIAPAFTGFADMPPVFATAYMVGFVEWTCVEALRPYLGAHQRTVGTHVDMSHAAATPVGMRVSATVELVSVEGRKLRFKVECRDEVDVIGSGFHERAIIDFDKFMQRVQRKGGDA